MRFRKRVGLLGASLEFRAFFLDQFALMDVELRLLQQTDGLQMPFDDVAEFGDGRGHEFSARLPIAAFGVEYGLELVDQEGRVAALAKYRGNDPRQRHDPLEVIEV